MSIQRKCSIYSQYVSNNVNGFMVLTRKLIVCFSKRLLSSDNIIIKSIVNSAYFNLSSQISKRLQKIAFYSSINNNICDLNQNLIPVYMYIFNAFYGFVLISEIKKSHPIPSHPILIICGTQSLGTCMC